MELFGVRWSEFNKSNILVVKEKFFSSEENLDKFVLKIEQKDNFNEFKAWRVPCV